MTRLKTDFDLSEGAPVVIAFSENEHKAYVDGKPCRLTAQEFRLLLALAEQAGNVLSREQLLCDAWDYQSPGKSRTVDVHVQRLRRKMGFTLFETVHGEGYRLRAQPLSQYAAV